jgi:hypothetical protein
LCNGDVTSGISEGRCQRDTLPGAMKCRVLITILFCFSFLGCSVAIFSYPPFWDYSKAKPKENDLVGSYRVLKLRLPSELKREAAEKEARITLNADHTAILADVPEFDGFGQKLECRLSGSATWELDDMANDGLGWDVTFHYHSTSKVTNLNCKYEDFIFAILILSRHSPYRLYDIVGDPDSDTGIEYARLQ